MSKKKAIELNLLGPVLKSRLIVSRAYKEEALNRGFGNGTTIEPQPNYIVAGSERVFEGKSNAAIVLGRDRPQSRLSGYGGRGDTHASAMDIVVGRMGYRSREVDDNGQAVWVDPDFTNDAARIYLSQKSDVDDYFKLSDGRVGNKKTRSSIGIKADGVRIIGREGVKIVTRTDEKNSQGGNIESVAGIDLIAGNDDRDLQPMLKGDNTAEAMSKIIDDVKDLTSLFENFITSQMKLNATTTAHVHVGNLGLPTLPSFELVTAGITTNLQQTIQTLLRLPLHRTNMETQKLKYLEPMGDKYIKSRHNNTN